jgi:hypothetical protein
VFARPGLRAIWHRAARPVGIGAGLGSTLVWFDSHGAASISPELLVHFGHCCHPGYFTLSVRAGRGPTVHETAAPASTRVAGPMRGCSRKCTSALRLRRRDGYGTNHGPAVWVPIEAVIG